MRVHSLLPHRALIRVGGPEARPFLHRLLTQEVETLAEGGLRYGALLTPQGRVLYDLFLFGEAEAVRVDVAADRRDELLSRLKLFRLRAAVTLDLDEDPVWAAWGGDAHGDGPAPPAPGWRPDPRTPAAGWRFAGPQAPAGGGEPVAAQDHFAARVALGLPDAVRDRLSDKAYVTELDLDLLNGVDYRKGCFPGQETTSRMKRRGGVRSRVLPLRVEGAERGAEVLAGSMRAGEVTAAHAGRALALLRLDRLDGPLTVGDAPAALARPPWWPDGEPPFGADGDPAPSAALPATRPSA